MERRLNPKIEMLNGRIDAVKLALMTDDTIIKIAKSFDVSKSTFEKFMKLKGLKRKRIKYERKRKRSMRICQCCRRRHVPAQPVDGMVTLTRLCEDCWRDACLQEMDVSSFAVVNEFANDSFGWVSDSII